MLNPIAALRNAAARFVARSLEAAGGGRRFAAHLVGYGFTPIPKHPDERVRKALVALWNSFVRVADPAGRMDLHGLAKPAALSMIRDGECFAIMRSCNRPATPTRR